MDLPSYPPSRNKTLDFYEFANNYWDIFFGIGFGFLAYFFHTCGQQHLSVIFSALAIMSFSITIAEIAEILAERLGEPYGSFLLTFCAVAIEILLLYMLFMRSGGADEIAAMTVKSGIISAVIVDLNLLLGIAVLVGGLRFKLQEHNEETSSSYTTILLSTAVVLLVPSVLDMTDHSKEVIYKASVFMAFLLVGYYVVIAIFQTKTHINFFKATARSRLLRYKKRHSEEEEDDDGYAHREYLFDRFPSWLNMIIMTLVILFVGILAELLANDGLKSAVEVGISPAAAGLIISFIAVAPEFFTAVKAARNDEPQRVINIAMGASTVTMLLSVPFLVFLAYFKGIAFSINFNALEIGALIFTVLLTWKTTANGVTDYMEGISHLVVFAAYLILAFYF
jgi:Ca2+:H+ antiporter